MYTTSQPGSDSGGGGGGDSNALGWPSAEELAVEAALDQGLWSASHSLASEFTPVAASSLLLSGNGLHPSVPFEVVGSTDASGFTDAAGLAGLVGSIAPLRAGEYAMADVLSALAANGFGGMPRKEVVRLLWRACRLRVGHEGELLKPARQLDVAFVLEVLSAKRAKVYENTTTSAGHVT